eukprot:scaffold17787_cov18-Tisochrysis_lutea.AAC.1
MSPGASLPFRKQGCYIGTLYSSPEQNNVETYSLPLMELLSCLLAGLLGIWRTIADQGCWSSSAFLIPCLLAFSTVLLYSGSQGCSSCPTPMAMPNLPARPTTLPPTPIDGPTAHPMDGSSYGNDRGVGPGHRVMLSEEEQLAFFKNLQRS